MTEREMFEKSFERPTNYFKLSGRRQWEIDEALGILDWAGGDLSKEDKARFNAHYGIKPSKPKKSKTSAEKIVEGFSLIKRL
jgi:hypothetical protein